MTRAEQVVQSFLKDVSAEDCPATRELVHKTLAYQSAAFLDALEALAMEIVAPFVRFWERRR